MDQGRRNWLRAGTGIFLGSMAGAFSGKGIEKAAFAQSGTAQSKLGSDQIAFPNSPLNSGKPLGNKGQELPPEALSGPWKDLRAVKAKKVFDIHAHGYTPDQAEGPNATYAEEIKVRTSTPWLDKTDSQLKDMDRHGIAQAAVTADFVPLEMYEESKYSKHPNRFIRTIGHTTNEIKDAAEISPETMVRIVKEQIAKGAKMYGETGTMLGVKGEQYTIKDVKPIVDVLLENDLAVQFHTGWTAAYGGSTRYPYQAPWHWTENMGNFMAMYPQLKVILAHAGGSTGEPDGFEALRLLYSFDNCYFDTSKTTPEIVTEAVRGAGAERVLFGTDWTHPELVTYGPFHFRACYMYWYNLNTIALANVTEDQRDQILYKSARKLLHLPEA